MKRIEKLLKTNFGDVIIYSKTVGIAVNRVDLLKLVPQSIDVKHCIPCACGTLSIMHILADALLSYSPLSCRSLHIFPVGFVPNISFVGNLLH